MARKQTKPMRNAGMIVEILRSPLLLSYWLLVTAGCGASVAVIVSAGVVVTTGAPDGWCPMVARMLVIFYGASGHALGKGGGE